MKTLNILIVLAFLTLFGCENKQESAAPKAEPPATAAQPTKAPQQAPAQEVAVADVPTAADFEQQALDEINADNVETELDKLEKDIGE